MNQYNAQHLKARVVVEGANGPTTFKADQALEARGVQIIPDMLANVGGVTLENINAWFKICSNSQTIAIPSILGIPGIHSKPAKYSQNTLTNDVGDFVLFYH